MTKAEKWFGKKKKDLTPDELKEFWRLDAQERRNNPKVREYHKQYNRQYNAQYRKDNKEKINQSIKDWKQKNPDKVKNYRYAKLNREIEYLKQQLKETTDLMLSYMQENIVLWNKWNKLREWAKNSTEVLLYSIDDKPAKLGNKKYNYFEREQLLDKMQELDNGEKR